MGVNSRDDDEGAEAEHEVGYGKPPKETRFKPGQSGNPKGRPKRSKGFKQLVREVLDEAVAVSEGGRVRKISTKEALLKTLKARALKGDAKAIGQMLALIEKHMPDEPVADPAGGTVEIVFVSAVDGKPAPGQHYYEKMEEEEKERRALQQKVR